MNKSIFTSIAIVIILVLIAYGISVRLSSQKQSAVGEGVLRVTATFYPLAYLAQQIGGEYVQVTNLTPPGSEPHDFDPSPQDIVRLHGSNVFLYNGAGLEAWLPKVLPELEQENVLGVNTSAAIELLPAPNADEGSIDPHIWLDPVLYAQQADAVAAAFTQQDPARAAAYRANAAHLQEQLGMLNKEFETGLASCKLHDIVTSHAAFQYMAKRYGLTMTSIAGLSPDEEPSPARLAEIADFVRDNQVKYIFFETLVSPRIAETIAQETGAQTISFNPLEGLSDEEIQQGKDYISVQRENLQALKVALDCI